MEDSQRFTKTKMCTYIHQRSKKYTGFGWFSDAAFILAQKIAHSRHHEVEHHQAWQGNITGQVGNTCIHRASWILAQLQWHQTLKISPLSAPCEDTSSPDPAAALVKELMRGNSFTADQLQEVQKIVFF